MAAVPRPSTIRLSTRPRLAVAAAATTATFLLLDAAWLTAMASRLYRPSLGHLMREDFDLLAAAAFYALYLIGVVCFVLRPAAGAAEALARGALYGLVCYATYDLTNQATLVGWPWHVTLVDLCWGAFVTGVSACIGAFAGRPRSR
jgi:uncharacterized membrane protein